MKAFTNLEQSHKLNEILPIESADMKILPFTEREYRVVPINDIAVCGKEDEIPCWSLSALLEALPNENMLVKTTDGEYYCLAKDVMTKHYDNSIDACYEMILKLHELKML